MLMFLFKRLRKPAGPHPTSVCHNIFTDRSIFRLLFPRNRSVPVYVYVYMHKLGLAMILRQIRGKGRGREAGGAGM